MKRFLREPLLHFLALGALLFVVYSVLNRRDESTPGRIVVSQGQLASMMETFTRTWQRQPTREEWGGLIRARVREEVYCREAVALGLDKDDLIIRRRLAQKMEFVSDDLAAQSEPTESELDAYLKTHFEQFRVEQSYTFRQLYLDPAKHGESLARDAAQLLAMLNQAGSDRGAVGDTFMLESDFTAIPGPEIARQFGSGFASRLSEIPPGRWQGPFESAFGVHLVYVSERTEGRLPALADVREAVRREWDNARRSEANERRYQEVLKHYTVVIEQPAPAQAKKVAEAR